MQDTWTLRARWMRIASRKARRSSGPESTRSPSGARAQMGAIDRVSEHRTALIKSRLWRIVGRHVDASRLFDHYPTSERKVGSWARVVGHDSTDFGKSDGANRITKWTACIRRGNSSLKIDVFSLLFLTFD